MSVNHSISVCLPYGTNGRFSCEIESSRVLACHLTPETTPNLQEAVRGVLSQPLGAPPLDQVVFPGDRVVLALDRHTPQAATLIAEIWRICERKGITPSDALILQPAALESHKLADPRSELPRNIARQIAWKVHEATDESEQVYLASTASGERIYLARDVVDADVVLPVGQIAFDPVLGYRGTGSVFYPGLSTPESFRRARGQGHEELGLDDERPLRQIIDEIAWLMGVQFSVQVIASAGDGACHVLAGALDSVLRRGKEFLNESWAIQLDSRSDVVVVAIDSDAAGHGWEQLGAAVATARNLVAPEGKIVALSGLDASNGHGIQVIRDSETPRDALKPLRALAPADLIPATQLAQAADWADVYLLSDLDGDVVEELFLIPLDDEKEVQRLLSQEATYVLLGAAQHTYGRVRSA